jgi:hypothetical protein
MMPNMKPDITVQRVFLFDFWQPTSLQQIKHIPYSSEQS